MCQHGSDALNSAWRRPELDVWCIASGVRYVARDTEKDVDSIGSLVFSGLHEESEDILDYFCTSGGGPVTRERVVSLKVEIPWGEWVHEEDVWGPSSGGVGRLRAHDRAGGGGGRGGKGGFEA